MALVKYINYYEDDDGYLRRIPWDTWMQDGSFAGLAPVGIKNQEVISISSTGVVTCDTDFLDIAQSDDVEKRDSEVTLLVKQTSEKEFLSKYDNVCYYYESEFAQTYELDYDKAAYKE